MSLIFFLSNLGIYENAPHLIHFLTLSLSLIGIEIIVYKLLNRQLCKN